MIKLLELVAVLVGGSASGYFLHDKIKSLFYKEETIVKADVKKVETDVKADVSKVEAAVKAKV